MIPKRTLVIGDIHGHVDALNGALDAASFNIEEDRIICLGDYVDGWNYSFEVVRTLLEIKNQSKYNNIFLIGNHDKWFLEILDADFSQFRNEEYISRKYSGWYSGNGRSTYESYVVYPDEFIAIHKKSFFDQLKYYHIENNQLFVHAGFHLDLGFEKTWETKKNELLWDRSLYGTAYQIYLRNENLVKRGQEKVEMKFGGFDTIFIGHTPTPINGFLTPTKMANVINLDQGCKKNGRLTVWELETGKYYQNK